MKGIIASSIVWIFIIVIIIIIIFDLYMWDPIDKNNLELGYKSAKNDSKTITKIEYESKIARNIVNLVVLGFSAIVNVAMYIISRKEC